MRETADFANGDDEAKETDHKQPKASMHGTATSPATRTTARQNQRNSCKQKLHVGWNLAGLA